MTKHIQVIFEPGLEVSPLCEQGHHEICPNPGTNGIGETVTVTMQRVREVNLLFVHLLVRQPFSCICTCHAMREPGMYPDEWPPKMSDE